MIDPSSLRAENPSESLKIIFVTRTTEFNSSDIIQPSSLNATKEKFVEKIDTLDKSSKT